MDRKLVPTLLALSSALAVLIGALAAVLMRMAYGIATNHAGPILAGLSTGALAVVIGIVALEMHMANHEPGR